MSKFVFMLAFALLALTGLSVQAMQNSTDSKKTEDGVAHIQLDSLYLDLGAISADEVAEGVMRFRNTGNAPLIIKRIFSDCGCTVPDYDYSPVAPGAVDSIKVLFNAKGRDPGPFQKTLRIRSNADNSREIFFVKGRVKRIYKR